MRETFRRVDALLSLVEMDPAESLVVLLVNVTSKFLEELVLFP